MNMWVSKMTEDNLTKDVIDCLLYESLNKMERMLTVLLFWAVQRQQNIEVL